MTYEPYIATEQDLFIMSSPTMDRRYRFMVGNTIDPVALSIGEAGFPVDYNLTYTLSAPYTVQTQNTVTFITTGGLPSAGTMIIGIDTTTPVSIRYTNINATQLLGVTYDFGLGVAFGAGTTCGPLVEVTQFVDDMLDFVEERDEENVIDWTAGISGFNYDSSIFPKDAIFIALEQYSPYPTMDEMTDWVVKCWGFCRDYNRRQDANGNNLWQSTIVSISAYLDEFEMEPVTFGVINVAEGASVNASPELLNPYLELVEFDGNFLPINAAAITDDSFGSLYISNDLAAPATETAWPGGNAFVVIDELQTAGPPGTHPLFQYIILRLPPGSMYFNEEGISMDNFMITHKDTTFYPHAGSDVIWPKIPSGGYMYLEGIRLTSNSPRVLLCPDARVLQMYMQVNSMDGIQVISWKTLPGRGDDQLPSRDFVLGVAADYLHIRHYRADYPTDSINCVPWGPIDYWHGDVNFQEMNADIWDGPTCDPPPPGSSLRRVPTCINTRTKGDWAHDPRPIPTDDKSESTRPYFAITINPTGAALTDAITAVSPANGESMTVNNAYMIWPSGFIQIFGTNEFIRYGTRDGTTLYNIRRAQLGSTAQAAAAETPVLTYGRSTFLTRPLDHLEDFGSIYVDQTSYITPEDHIVLVDDEWIGVRNYFGPGQFLIQSRGVYGTTPATHATGAVVWQNDSLGAHTMPIVRGFTIERKLKQFTSGTTTGAIVPIEIEAWIAHLPSPALPGSTPEWEMDYYTGHRIYHFATSDISPGATYQYHEFATPYPIAVLLVIIRRMSDGGRAKVNTSKVFSAFALNTPLAGLNDPIFYVLSQLLPASRILLQNTGLENIPEEITIPRVTAMRWLRDAAKRYMFTIDFTRDGRVQVYRDPYYTEEEIPLTAILRRDQLRDDMPITDPALSHLGQVSVNIRNPKTSYVYEASYPPKRRLSSTIRYEVILMANSSDVAVRMAKALFRRHPEVSRSFDFESVGPAPWLRPGQMVLFPDFSDNRTTADVFRLGMVIRVKHAAAPDLCEQFTVREWRVV